MSRLPADVRWLARLLLAPEMAEVVLGDLLEESAALFGSGPSVRRAVWMRWQLLRSVAAVSAARLEGPATSAASLALDLRVALRAFRRRPGVSALAVLSLGLALAGATATFSLVDAVLLAPLPYEDPASLVRLRTGPGEGPASLAISAPVVDALDETPGVSLSAVGRVRMVVPGGDGSVRLRGEAVDGRYFRVLQAVPALGRLPEPEAYAPSPGGGIVISDRYWHRRYGGDPAVLGSSVSSTRASYRILGVMPPDFVGTTEEDEVDFWLPIEAWVAGETDGGSALLEDPRQTWLRSVGRLAPGVASGTAATGLRERARSVEGLAASPGPTLEPLGLRWRDAVRPGLSLLLGGGLCILLLACLNAGGLLLARLVERGTELWTRRALGAPVAVVGRMLLLEAFVLVAAGGLVGAALSVPTEKVLSGLVLTGLAEQVSLPTFLDPSVDARALAVGSGLVFLTTLLAAAVPLSLLGRLGLSLPTPSRSLAGDRARLGEVLSAGQVALAAVLLLGAGLLVRSYGSFTSADPGFRVEQVAKFQVTGGAEEDGRAPGQLTRRTLEAALAHPAVSGAAAVAPSPPLLDLWAARIGWPGGPAEPLRVSYHAVSDDFFETLEVPTLAGSVPRGSAAEGTVVLGRSLAARIAGTPEAAVGREVEEITADGTRRLAVAGVVEDISWQGAAASVGLDLYVSLDARPSDFFGVVLRVPEGSVLAPVADLRRAVAAVDPTAVVHWVESMPESVAAQGAGLARRTVLLAGISALALLVTAVGLYAVLALTGSFRGGEYALRKALGATGSSVAGSVVARALRTVGAGLAVGIPGGLLFGRVLEGLLHGIRPWDLPSIALTAVVLAGVGLAAAAVPARKAARTSPMTALRSE